MATNWMTNRRFICVCDNCTNKDNILKRYKWSDDDKSEKCEFCSNDMIEVFEEIGEVSGYLRFNSLSEADKRTILKKRSQEHFKKEIRERKEEQSKKFYQDIKRMTGR
jgi:hypothetical protein